MMYSHERQLSVPQSLARVQAPTRQCQKRGAAEFCAHRAFRKSYPAKVLAKLPGLYCGSEVTRARLLARLGDLRGRLRAC